MADFADLSFRVDSRPLRGARDDLRRMGREGTDASARLERGLGRLNAAARSVGGALATIGVGLTLGSVIETLGGFEASMAKVKAISGATDDQFQALRETAKSLGSTTEFTASQAADAMGFLSMAGFSAAEALEAIPTVLDLATASGMDLARTADIASNVLSGFQLEVAETARVADVLAKSASISNTNVEQMGNAMSYAAPVAAALGISIEEAAAAVGVLSDAGIQGERAGTSLRTALSQLGAPSKDAHAALTRLGLTADDVNPALNSMGDIFASLRDAGVELADATDLVGIEAASSLLVLTSGAAKYDEYTGKLRGATGAAGEMAGTMRDQLNGAIQSFGSSIEGLIIALGDAGLTDVLRSVIDTGTEFVRMLSGMDNLAEVATTAGIAAAAIGAMVFPFAAVAVAAAASAVWITTHWQDLRNLFPGLVGSLESAAATVGAVLRGDWSAAWTSGKDAITGLLSSFQNLTADVMEEIGFLAASIVGELLTWPDAFGNWLKRTATKFSQAFRDSEGDVLAAIVALGQVIWSEMAAWPGKLVAVGKDMIDGLASGLKQGSLSISWDTLVGPNIMAGIRKYFDIKSPSRVMMGVGHDIVDGLAIGITQRSRAAEGAAVGVANGVLTGAKRALDIRSPSRKFHGVGAMSIDGMIDGIEDRTGALVAQIEDTAQRSIDSASSAFESGVRGMVDYMMRGFEDGLGGLVDMFKRTLMDMAATAATNKIMIGLGFGPSGAGAMGSGLMSSMGGVLGGIGSTLGGLGTTFMQSAIGIFSADMAGLGATLAGATSSLSGFAAAAGALALPIASAVAAFDFFRQKTKKLDEGVRLTTEGMTTAVESWERIRKTRFWGLSTDTDNHYSGAPSDIASPLKQAVGEMQAGIVQAADALGVGKRAFADFSHQIKLSTKGMTEDEAVRALQEELGGLGEAFAAMVPGVNRLRAVGESAADVLARTATSLTTVNSAFRTLGFDRLDESLRGGKTANRLVELSGGLQQFASATEFYFQNIMSAPDRLRALTRQFNQALTAANINVRPGNATQFQRQVERMMENGARRKATALINLAPLFTEIQRLQGELDTTGDKAGSAADRLAAREQKAADIARERAGLEAQLLRLSGDQKAIRQAELAELFPANRALQRRIWGLEREAEAAQEASARQEEAAGLYLRVAELLGHTNVIRQKELEALHPSLRAIQERIYRIQDEKAAEEAAAAIADERLGIQRQVWQLTGDTAAIQKDLLASLSPANRALQQHVWSLEKQAKAAEKASAILDERRGLEGSLLDLQGNTAEIRRRELQALDPSNRALQQRIWKLEDEAAAAEKASAVADERLGIQRRIWELTGNTAAIQRDLLSALDPSNRALQQHAWSLEKQAEAAEKASAVADERTSLENRLLELQGNTAELRRRELAGLDASNRALQLMIWGLEDAAKAMEALDPADFASRLDFERARARAANGVGGVTSTGVPLAVIPQTPVQAVRPADEALRREMRDALRKIAELTVRVEQNTFKSATIAARQDRKVAG